MAPVIVVAGYGIGISAAVATSFAKKGFSVALLSRTQARLDAAAEVLKTEHGVEARGFAVDLSDFEAVKGTIAKIHNELGKVTVLLWNPYGGAKGILDGAEQDYVSEFKVTTSGLLAAVQAAHEDMKSQPGESAVLVTGGGLGMEHEASVKMAVAWNAASLAIGKAAQRKAVDIIAETLAGDGIYVGEVTVMAAVKNTAFDAQGTATLTPEEIADKFQEIYAARSPRRVQLP